MNNGQALLKARSRQQEGRDELRAFRRIQLHPATTRRTCTVHREWQGTALHIHAGITQCIQNGIHRTGACLLIAIHMHRTICESSDRWNEPHDSASQTTIDCRTRQLPWSSSQPVAIEREFHAHGFQRTLHQISIAGAQSPDECARLASKSCENVRAVGDGF